MRSTIKAAALALALASLGSPAMAGRPPELPDAELMNVQSRHYAVPPKVAFNSVLASLQTLGFVDINANRDAGTVSAVTDSKAKTILNIFWGFGKKKWTEKASLLIEDEGAGSLVRLNLMLSETKSRGIFGTSFTDGQIVRERDPYIDFFHIVDGEVARRGGTAAASGAVTPDGSGRLSLGGVRLRPSNAPSGYCIEAGPGYVGTGAGNMPAATSARPLCG